MQKNYCEIIGKHKPFGWKIYHYDFAGNCEVILHASTHTFANENLAFDNAAEWMEDNNIEAEIMF